MAKFINITNNMGGCVLVNTAYIVSVAPCENGSTVTIALPGSVVGDQRIPSPKTLIAPISFNELAAMLT